MMHSTLHFSLGMLLGTAWHARAICCAWRSRRPLARRLGAWLLACYGLGLFAIAPNLLRRAGVSHDACEAAVMNVFLFSPALNRIVGGGSIVGPFVLGLMVAGQYALLLIVLRRTLRARSARS